jgi:hypothetical protein
MSGDCAFFDGCCGRMVSIRLSSPLRVGRSCLARGVILQRLGIGGERIDLGHRAIGERGNFLDAPRTIDVV